MKYLFYFSLIAFTLFSCGKDNPTPMEPDPMDGMDNPDTTGTSDPVIMLEDVLSDWNIEIDFRTCSSIDVSFSFEIIGDSTLIGDFGYIIENENLDYKDTLRSNYQEIQGVFLDLLLDIRSRSEIDPTLPYEITPFVEISDSIFYGVPEIHTIENFTTINIESLLDLKDYNLGYSYISEATAVRIGQKGYVIGGLIGNSPDPINQSISDVFLEIDFDNNSIIALESFPYRASSMVSFVYDGEIYAGGGRNDNQEYTEFYKYKFDLGWELVADFPDFFGLAGGYALVHNEYVYIGMGLRLGPIPETSRSFYRFDPRDSTWTALALSPLGASGGISFVIDDKIYISHGSGSWFDAYDISTDTWSSRSGGGLLQDAVSFVRGQKGYAYSGGYVQTGTSINIYDSILEEWTETCIENSDYRTYEGVVFDNGIDNPVVGLGNNSRLFTLNL